MALVPKLCNHKMFSKSVKKSNRILRVNVDSVVDLVVYMYLLLCFPVLSLGFVVSVVLLQVVNPVDVYYGI